MIDRGGISRFTGSIYIIDNLDLRRPYLKETNLNQAL
jgi:hypothetical protein